MNTSSPVITRRSLLGAGAGAVALAGIGPVQTSQALATAATYAKLVADPVFYVAHRGGGGDWPEMTNYAYRHAVQLPAIKALEVSVRLTADNVLVCSHDDNLLRTTGKDLFVSKETWATLSTLKVDASETNQPSQLPRNFSRFDDVLAAFMDNYVLYVEPKTTSANAPLMQRMVGLGQPQRVVWKQPINSTVFAQAKSNGFATWGYVLNEAGHLGTNLTRYAASKSIDMLGVPRAQPDAFVTTVVQAAKANGKKTMMWEIRNVADRTRAIKLGCSGMMTSGVTAVTSTPL
ncbi:MAG TPA: glycerophosphodiester phosphodiesterase family protein [Propionibacteriaceae bacterium]